MYICNCSIYILSLTLICLSPLKVVLMHCHYWFLCTDFIIILFITPFWPLLYYSCLPSFLLKILISKGFPSCRFEHQYPSICHFPGIICSLTFYQLSSLIIPYLSLTVLQYLHWNFLIATTSTSHYHFHQHQFQECCIKLTYFFQRDFFLTFLHMSLILLTVVANTIILQKKIK